MNLDNEIFSTGASLSKREEKRSALREVWTRSTETVEDMILENELWSGMKKLSTMELSDDILMEIGKERHDRK